MGVMFVLHSFVMSTRPTKDEDHSIVFVSFGPIEQIGSICAIIYVWKCMDSIEWDRKWVIGAANWFEIDIDLNGRRVDKTSGKALL